MSARACLRAAAVAVLLASCQGRSEPPPPAAEVAVTARSTAMVSALRARLAPAAVGGAGAALAQGPADAFRAQAGGLRPRFGASAGPASARVLLPARSTAPAELEDLATGARVDVSLEGARDVAPEAADGFLVYPRAHLSGATLLHRALPEGTEDFLDFQQRPGAPAVRYRVALRQGVKGLRLVANTLELLDAGGAPRLRMAPPYVVGADGVRTDAAIAVEGCAVDTSAAPPWGRPVTAPGADACTVRVSWDDGAVAYPALLDPRWTTTGSMGTARQGHTATVLSTGRVLVAGGSNGTSALASAELYDRTTGTWAATGSMTGARQLHSATQLGTSSNGTTSGKVLVAGGVNGTTSQNTAQLYSPTAGTWTAATNLNAARHLHTATLLASGRVLVAGGLGGTTVLNTAATYDPTSGAGTWTAVGNMAFARTAHTATLLASSNASFNNKVLVVGGNSGGTTSLTSVQLFDGTSAWTTTTALASAREGQRATPLANGNVLVTGGKSGTTTLGTALVFTIPASGTAATWAAAGTMTSARQAHTATLLPAGVAANGQVLVIGGFNGTSALPTAELWNGASTWTATTSMAAAVQGHTASLLGNNAVLIAGGVSGSTTQSAAQLYDPSFGLTCTAGSQCATGFCVNGVCCDTACTNQCSACNLPGLSGTCSPKANGTACNDGNLCTRSDTCQAGTCAGASPIACTAQDQCHVAGTCAPATGVCSNPAAAEGTACSDGNVCTRTDSCKAGACVGSNAVQCAALDVCHAAGACDPETGTCSAPPLLGGACQLGAFDYDKAGRMVRDRGTDLVYDGYDQLREVRPSGGTPPPLVDLPIDDLGSLGGSVASAVDVNASGHATGYASLAGGHPYHAFLSTGPGPMLDLSVQGSVPGDLIPLALNDSDVVVGAFAPPGATAYHVFRYDSVRGLEDLAVGQGLDVNDQDQVAGYLQVGSNAHAFRYTDGGGFLDLGTLGGANSYGMSIDGFGSIVGAAQLVDSPSSGFEGYGHAFVFNDLIGLQDLNPLVNPRLDWTLVAAAGTAGDWIVGIGKRGDGLQHAFRMRLSTGAVDDLGMPSWALAINSYGDAVGSGSIGSAQQFAFVYNDQLGVKNLNDLIDPASGWNLKVANSINDVGDVVGWGLHDGVTAAFRMRVPLHTTTTGGPTVAVVHTYGFDGQRTSTSTGVGTASPKSQYWFTQDYTEHDGQRDHYIRLGERVIARVTTQPVGGGGAGMTTGERRGAGGGRGPVPVMLALALLAVAALSVALGVGARRRRRWVPALAGLASLILGAGSCQMFGGSGGALGWTVADSSTLYFHQGISPGPNLLTDRNGALSEERRYEPFGQPLDAYKPGAGVVAVDFRHDPQNILGKQTDPNTGWSYHGARWMAPEMARWVSPDPAVKAPDAKHLFAPWDLNPYAYAAGNPVLFWDPDGMRASWRDNTPAWARAVATIFGAAAVMDWAERSANDLSEHPNDNLVRAKAILGAPVVALQHARSTANRAQALSHGLEAARDALNRHLLGNGPLGTHSDEAVFYSGIGKGGENKAEQWAKQHGGKTLEMTLRERGVDLPMWNPENPDVVKAWQDASVSFAEGAKGNVRVLQSGDWMDFKPRTPIWAAEFKALRANENVTSITAVNPDTGAETVLWQRNE